MWIMKVTWLGGNPRRQQYILPKYNANQTSEEFHPANIDYMLASKINQGI